VGLSVQVGFFLRLTFCLKGLGSLDTKAPLTGDYRPCKHSRNHANTSKLQVSATVAHTYPLYLFLLRWLVLDIKNVLLEPVTGSHDRLSTVPSTPSPPSKPIAKCDNRQRSAATGRMLKLIAVLRVTSFEKSTVEVIVQSFT
jgi:hypothetical protein